MWYVLIMITAISGYPLGYAVEETEYPTEEACRAALPDIAHKAQKLLEPQDQIVAGAACAKESELPEGLRKALANGKK